MTSLEKNLQDQVKQLLKENQQLRRQNEQSKAAYDQLLFQMKEMIRHRFGQRCTYKSIPLCYPHFAIHKSYQK